MKNVICGICMAVAAYTLATPPEVANVHASQRADTKLVDIYYDATDADGDLLKIRVEISDNDGARYSVPAFTLSGDIGEGVSPGTGKHIVWDAGADWDGEYSDKMRVKVFAIDAKGFPGMEWSNEVKPGGFLLGQDGGAEGNGESQHVNIKWSYWIGKREVTSRQYCDFLNAAIVTGDVGRDGAATVYATETMPASFGCPIGATLCNIGDDWCIRWNVNNFEVVSGWENKPAIVTWYGAMAFCRFYGYDLPTEAEWEKAARGPDFDDQDEHHVYPWGDTCSSSQAYTAYATSYVKASGLAAVDAYDVYTNGYGVSGVVGNAAEWTRSSGESALDDYPAIELLLDDRQLPYTRVDRVVKGVGGQGLYYRRAVDEMQFYCTTNSNHQYFFVGFRPVRRASGVKDIALTKEVFEDFNTITTATSTFSHNGMTWSVGSTSDKCFQPLVGNGGSGGVMEPSNYTSIMQLPTLSGRLCFVRLKARNIDSSEKSLYCNSSLGVAEYVSLPAFMSDFAAYQIPVVLNAVDYGIRLSSYYALDDIELWTVPRQ